MALNKSGRMGDVLTGLRWRRLQVYCARPVLPLLIIAALLFPFSVAISNLALGLVLFFALLSGLLWQGMRICYTAFRKLSFCFGIYFLLMIMGLGWSLDLSWGLHVLGHQWFWLLVPVLVAALAERRYYHFFLLALSVGLTAHLIVCVLQMFSYLSIATDGSSARDATGYIGHVGFGMVYGVWAAWLLCVGLSFSGYRRWAIWSLAGWAYIMIFAAQGRSGYVVAAVMVMAVLFTCYKGRSRWRQLAITSGFIALIAVVFSLGPGHERLQGTWQALSGQQQEQLDQAGDVASKATSYRLYMWQTAVRVWQDYPLAGVGTGGFPAAVELMTAAGQVDTGKYRSNPEIGAGLAHPHNQYLLDLARWGPVGLLCLLGLLYFWVHQGWIEPWRYAAGAPLIGLSGLSLVVYGVFEPGMEEHFSAIYAALMLASGLARIHMDDIAGHTSLPDTCLDASSRD